MDVDIGNSLASVASPGVSRASLDRLDREVAEAHDRIEGHREAGDFGYAALDLPSRVDLDALDAAIEPVADAEAVLTVGIGGSALGAATVTRALGGPDVAHHTLDNVDPEHTTAVLDRLPLGEIAVNVVSRSGTTLETLANLFVVREAMAAAGVDWTERTVVTTGGSGPLADLAEEHGLPWLPVPTGVPGRFSVLSAVGLLPAAVLGLDVGAVVEGAARRAEGLEGSVFETPAYAYGATAVALARRGVAVNVMMPYAEALEPFAEWFAQLWAESLGKDGLGQTPVRALGATDQHSQLQLYRSGPRNAMVTFCHVREREDVTLPAPDLDAIDYLEGVTMAELLDTELAATEASLAEAGRPTVRIGIDRLDPAGLGGLLYGLEAACVLAAELEGIDAFDQPAVEWGKHAAGGRLGGAETDAARALDHKTTLVVD